MFKKYWNIKFHSQGFWAPSVTLSQIFRCRCKQPCFIFGYSYFDLLRNKKRGSEVRVPVGAQICFGKSLIQRSPAECGVSECDREASTMTRPWPTRGCRAIKIISLIGFTGRNTKLNQIFSPKWITGFLKIYKQIKCCCNLLIFLKYLSFVEYISNSISVTSQPTLIVTSTLKYTCNSPCKKHLGKKSCSLFLTRIWYDT